MIETYKGGFLGHHAIKMIHKLHVIHTRFIARTSMKHRDFIPLEMLSTYLNNYAKYVYLPSMSRVYEKGFISFLLQPDKI